MIKFYGMQNELVKNIFSRRLHFQIIHGCHMGLSFRSFSAPKVFGTSEGTGALHLEGEAKRAAESAQKQSHTACFQNRNKFSYE